MNFLCPACRTPLPTAAPAVVSCSQCGVEVDLTRVDTAPGQAKLWPEVELSGEQLGNFKLVSRAGSGGMGTVYLAEGLAGRCAVKVLSAQMAADPQLRERFRREAAALRAVLHKGIVRIIDEGAQNGFWWYAMEHIDGPDLRAKLAKGPLPPAEVESMARELLDALAAVHDAQLVHRDLKPANILLSASGPKLCDFGIARFDGSTTLTESAALLGSLRYMAPEQRAGQTSAKSDLYSLGLVLHEALAKGLPGETELPGSTPRRLKRLIEALLQAAPRLRPESAQAAAKMIALPRPGRIPTAVLVGASVLGVAAFAGWAVIGNDLRPPLPRVQRDRPRPARPSPPQEEVPTPGTSTAAKLTQAPVPNQAPPEKPSAAVPVALADAGTKALAAKAAVDSGTPIVAQAVPAGFAHTELEPPDVSGGLDFGIVADVLSRHRVELASCYEDQLENDPALAGRLAVRFVVKAPDAQGRRPPLLRLLLGGEPPPGKKSKKKDPDFDTSAPSGKPAPVFGVVTGLQVTDSTLDNKAAIACMLKRIAQWRFPATRTSGIVAVAWTFAPSGAEIRETPLPAAKPTRAQVSTVKSKK